MKARLFLAPLTLIVILAFSLASRSPEAASSPQQVPPPQEPVVGTVVEWRMAKDGVVYLLFEESPTVAADDRRPVDAGARQRGEEDEDGIRRRWFRTPPIQGEQIHFQDLVLLIVLETQRRDSGLLQLAIWADPGVTTRGESPADAIKIDMIGAR